MTKVSYYTQTHTEDFEIDIGDQSGCNGMLEIQVIPSDKSMPLVLKDGSGQKITHQKPFVLRSSTPITSGHLQFVFAESNYLNTHLKTVLKKAIVRYLYCES